LRSSRSLVFELVEAFFYCFPPCTKHYYFRSASDGLVSFSFSSLGGSGGLWMEEILLGKPLYSRDEKCPEYRQMDIVDAY
jgi:hypothetical protein